MCGLCLSVCLWFSVCLLFKLVVNYLQLVYNQLKKLIVQYNMDLWRSGKHDRSISLRLNWNEDREGFFRMGGGGGHSMNRDHTYIHTCMRTHAHTHTHTHTHARTHAHTHILFALCTLLLIIYGYIYVYISLRSLLISS